MKEAKSNLIKSSLKDYVFMDENMKDSEVSNATIETIVHSYCAHALNLEEYSAHNLRHSNFVEGQPQEKRQKLTASAYVLNMTWKNHMLTTSNDGRV